MLSKSLFISLCKTLLISDDIWDIPKVDVLFISPDAAKSEMYQGKYLERVLGPFMLALQNSIFTGANISRPFSMITGKRTWLHSYSLNRLGLKSAIIDRFQTSIGKERHYVKDLWKAIFINSGAKVILVHGVTANMCSAARELGIPIVEVLHGKGYTEAYKGWWEEASLEELPTHIFSFDEISTISFTSFGHNRISVIQLEDPWNDELIKYVTADTLESQNSIVHSTKLPIILFTLTWGYAGDHEPNEDFFEGIVPNGLIPEEVLEAIRQTNGVYEWKFRLHPKQMTELRYSKTRKKLAKILLPFNNAHWDSSVTIPLGKELSSASFHMSLSSMSSYEASKRGIPTLLLDPNFRPGGVFGNMFQDLKDAGDVTVAKDGSAEEIISWLKNPPECKHKHSDSKINWEVLNFEISKLIELGLNRQA